MKTPFLLILAIVLPLAVGCTNSADRAAEWKSLDEKMARETEESQARLGDTKIELSKALFGPESVKAQTYAKCLTHPPTQKANQATCERLELEIKRSADRYQAEDKKW